MNDLEKIAAREFDRAFAHGFATRAREEMVGKVDNVEALNAAVYDEMRRSGFKLNLVTGEYYLDRKVKLPTRGPADHLFPEDSNLQ